MAIMHVIIGSLSWFIVIGYNFWRNYLLFVNEYVKVRICSWKKDLKYLIWKDHIKVPLHSFEIRMQFTQLRSTIKHGVFECLHLLLPFCDVVFFWSLSDELINKS